MAGSLENESVWEVPGANGEMYGRFSRAVSTQLQSVRSSVILCFLDVRYELSKEPTDLSIHVVVISVVVIPVVVKALAEIEEALSARSAQHMRSRDR